VTTTTAPDNLKHKVMSGGLAKICSQGANFGLRVGSIMVMGRLLSPRDFGLVGMVMAFVGVLNVFKDFGLSTAAVQRADITEEQHSTLFWVNIVVGLILSVVALLSAPLVARFYHEPRLRALTAVLAVDFLFNAASVQHSALLQRQMRFTTMAVIEMLSLVTGIAVATVMALRGFGYWALVGMAIVPSMASTIFTWIAAGWVPRRPRRGVGMFSMLRFGGTITLNGLVVYLAYNLEKVLLGRYWGAEALGIYGRAYQFINIPTSNLNTAAGGVAFAALSRLQGEPARLRSYFLKGYSLVLALTVPLTLVCALFADDLIAVLLGPRWSSAAIVFRLLAPSILVFALINPLAWLLFSLGMVERSLKVALVLAPIVILGDLIGLSYGPRGVALSYSAVITLWALPHIAWCIHGTVISLRDILTVFLRPLVSGLAASLLPLLCLVFYGHLLNPILRLIVGSGLFGGVYLVILLVVMKQKAFYLDLLRVLTKRPSVREGALASA
jgi:PST family polysaccharide transporter